MQYSTSLAIEVSGSRYLFERQLIVKIEIVNKRANECTYFNSILDIIVQLRTITPMKPINTTEKKATTAQALIQQKN